MAIRPHKISFDREKCTLLLHISKEDIDIPEYVSARAEREGLVEKEKFHITIFGFGIGQRIGEKLLGMEGEDRSKALDSLEYLANETVWKIELKNDFYRIRKSYSIKGVAEERESYIEMVEVGELERFLENAKDIVGIDLPALPAHITLYAKSSIEENMLSGIGISSEEELAKANPVPLVNISSTINTIALPTRSQPDTIIAIFILKRFGGKEFPGIENANYVVMPRVPEGEDDISMAKQGVLLVDVGGGVFDHHSSKVQTTASNLVSGYLGVDNNPALSRLLQFAERDDFYGKGIVSNDPLDRAFGLSGLIGSLNKKYVNEPDRVIEIILPIIDAFYEEEDKRAFQMPKELEEKLASGKAQTFVVKQRGKKLNCIFIETENASMAGFLRSKLGGGYDVVALRIPSGHVNILTRPLQRVDLRSLAVLIRLQEAEARGVNAGDDPKSLAAPGTLKQIPNWYYDTATNSMLNGGPNPKDIEPTAIDPFEFIKLLELGLSEKLWSPIGK